jgi:hypothetical protein
MEPTNLERKEVDSLARERTDFQDGDFRRQGGRSFRRDDGDSRREGSDPRRDFEREVRRVKKDFQRNVLPAVKRHSFYVSKSEMKRIKQRKAARRRRRQLRKFGEL